jgi:hypothetical protein
MSVYDETQYVWLQKAIALVITKITNALTPVCLATHNIVSNIKRLRLCFFLQILKILIPL